MKRPPPLRPAARKRAEHQRVKDRKEARESRLFLTFAVLGMVASTSAYLYFYAVPRMNRPHSPHRHNINTNSFARTNL